MPHALARAKGPGLPSVGPLETPQGTFPALEVDTGAQMKQDATIGESYWRQQAFTPWVARTPQAQRAVHKLLEGDKLAMWQQAQAALAAATAAAAGHGAHYPSPPASRVRRGPRPQRLPALAHDASPGSATGRNHSPAGQGLGPWATTPAAAPGGVSQSLTSLPGRDATRLSVRASLDDGSACAASCRWPCSAPASPCAALPPLAMMPSSFATWDVLVEQNRLQMMQRLERATSLARVATPPAATLPPPLRRGGPVLYTPPAECVVHPWTHAALTLWPPSSHLHDDGRTLVDFEADVLPAMSAVLACRPAGVGVSAAATPSPTAQLQLQQQGPGGSPPARSEDGAPASYGSSRAASATPRQQGAPREEAAAAGRQLPGAQLHPHSPAAAQQADAAFVGAGGQSPGRGQEGALDVAFALGDAVGHVQTAPLPVPPAASRAGSGAHRRHPAEDTSPRTTTSRQRDPAPAQLAPRASTRSHSHLLHSQASLPQQPAASADGGGASQRRASGGVAVGSATRPSASALPPALSSKPTSSPRSVEPPQPPLPQPSRTPSIAAVGGHHQADRARLLACELAEASFSGLAPPAAPAGYLDGIAGTDDQEDDGLGRQFSAFALQRLSGDDADAGAGARPLPQQEQFSSFLLARPPWQRGNSDAYHTPTLVGSTLGGGHPQGAFAQSVAGSFVIAGGAGGGALLGSLAAGAELLEGTDGDVSDPLIAQASAQAAGPPQADAYGNGGLTPQLSHGPHGPQQSEAPSPLSVDAAAPGLTGPEHAAEDTGDHAPLQHAVSSHGSQDPEEARDTVDLSDDVPSPGHAAAPALAEGGALHHVADRPSPSHNPVRTSGIHFTVVRSVAAAPLPTREEVEEARLLEELSRLQEEARASPSRQQMAAQDASRAARALNRMASETSHALGGFSSASSYAPAPGSAGVTMIKTVASRRHRRTSNASNGSTSGWGTPPFTPSSLPKASSQRYATKASMRRISSDSTKPLGGMPSSKSSPGNDGPKHTQGLTALGHANMQDIWA